MYPHKWEAEGIWGHRQPQEETVLWRQKQRLEWCSLKPKNICTPASWESQEQNLREPLEGACPSHTWILEPWLPGLWGNTFLLFYSSWFVRICCNKPQETNTGEKYVLVPVGCSNKIPQAGQLLRNSNFSQFWRLGSPGSGASQFGVWWELAFCFTDGAFSLCPHMEGTRELSGPLL